MELVSTTTKQFQVKKGLHDGIPIALGYAPVAMTFGLLAKTTGLSFFETVAMSIFIFAGAGQFIAISLIGMGAGAFELIFTEFVVNIRHLLMSASLSKKAEDDPKWMKAIYSFGLTDETFSVASLKEGKVNAFYMFGLTFISYSSWVASSGVGYVIGQSLPATLQESMGIALYCMFIGLLVPSIRRKFSIIILPLIAGICNAFFMLVQHVSMGWSVILSTLIAAVVVELIKKGRGNNGP
ncbi:MAG TPA: AzlC family ABC transporter permease [Massilibacterium sp.]|nr:AzlC family ABC transporter permease [Massilibacterium sp.]